MPEIFILLRQTLFWKQPEVILSQIRGTGWVFHFRNTFLGQKVLVSYSIVVVGNPIVGQSTSLRNRINISI